MSYESGIVADGDVDSLPVLDLHAFDQTREFLEEEADELIENLFRSFAERCVSTLGALNEALRQGDRNQLRMSAHSLKGVSATVGARRVQALCARLEASARDGTSEDVEELLSRLQREIQAARRALRDLRL